MTLAPLPDPNAVMEAILRAAVPATWYVGTSLPDSIQSRVEPTLLVSHLGGPTSDLEARPAVDVTVMGPSYVSVQGAVEIIEPRIMDARRVILANGRVVIVDEVEGQGFHEIPWDDSRVRRFIATFQFTHRRGGTL